jgi:hypothetical protein
MLEPRVAAHLLAELVAGEAGHAHVGEDEVRLDLARLGQRLLSIADGGDGDVLRRERHRHCLLDRDGVVSEENGTGHRCAASCRLRAAAHHL